MKKKNVFTLCSHHIFLALAYFLGGQKRALCLHLHPVGFVSTKPSNIGWELLDLSCSLVELFFHNLVYTNGMVSKNNCLEISKISNINGFVLNTTNCPCHESIYMKHWNILNCLFALGFCSTFEFNLACLFPRQSELQKAAPWVQSALNQPMYRDLVTIFSAKIMTYLIWYQDVARHDGIVVFT